ncbi:MAG: HAD-IC family P-type ATPase, partial [Bacilli bacterium]
LPMMITLVLSSNMKRMLKNNVLVRKLVGIETAGNLNVLFTDKTGTLTNGKLETISFMSGSLKKYYQETDLIRDKKLHHIVKMSIVCNNACNYSAGTITGGNSTDRALLSFIKLPVINNVKKIFFQSFDNRKKYSYCIVDALKKVQLIKGAPEVIMANCNYYFNGNGMKRVFINKREVYDELVKATKCGIRVLALASKETDVFSLNNLTFIGLVFIKDEVRKEALEGIKLVKSAHIQTVMITGDNKDTAIAIGLETGLLENVNGLVLTSEELKTKSDADVKKLMPDLRIVARALPHDKSRLVRLCQELHLVVGMTGDGVNDAPALKKADVGFSMGSGTQVAKEASDIVILDDNFKSIAQAILYGRTIFKSIRKFIIFQLTINLCAVSLSIIGPFIGIDTPVTVIQMLWINMVMDTLAGIAFAFEPALIEYMRELPKKKDEPIINRYMRNEILFTGIYSTILCILFLKVPFIHDLFRSSFDDKYFMTGFFGLFIFMGIFNCFNARTHRLNLLANICKNKAFIIVILFVLIIQLYLIYFGGSLFRTAGLTFLELQFMVLLAATVIPIDWLRKMFLKRFNANYGI